MKNTLVVVMCVALFGCTKGKNNNSGQPNPIYDTVRFEILGLEEKVMTQTDSLEFNVQVKHIGGTKDMVTLAVSDLPKTMTAGFYPQIDTPTFFSVIRFVTNGTDTGLHNIKVTAAGIRFSKDYVLPIRVIPQPVNPAAALAGAYTETGSCTIKGAVNNDEVTVSVVPPSFNKILISGIWNNASTAKVIADIDPVNKTIQIPFQQSSGETISGSGTYTSTSITLTYTVNAAFFNETCSTVLTR